MSTKTMKIGRADSDKATMQAAVVALIKASLITAYSSSATYALGDFVYYSGDGKIYKCTTAISTAEAWTSAHWSEATLNDVISAVNAAVASVDNKVDPDDIYPNLRVGFASFGDNLTPYSDESGAFQDNPTISQGTGTDNNTAIVTTGNFAQLREKQGNTLAVAQLVNDLSDFSATGGAVSTSGGVGTFTASESGQQVYKPFLRTIGHKYIAVITYKTATATSDVKPRMFGEDLTGQATTNWQTVFSQVYTAPASGGSSVGVKDARASDWDAIQVKDFFVADITSWPTAAITDLTAHPENFFRWYNGSLAYNAGSLENANGVKLVCTKRNLLNRANEEVGKALNQSGGLYNDASCSTSDYLLIIPMAPLYLRSTEASGSRYCWAFYDKNKEPIGNAYSNTNASRTPPANAKYARVTYRKENADDTDLSLYYTEAQGGEGYDQHYEYKEPTVIDTGSEVLRSAGNAHDVKLPDGSIPRNIGAVDLSTISSYISYDAGFGCWVVELGSANLPKGKFAGNYDIPNISDNLGTKATFFYGDKSNALSITTDGRLLVGNGSTSTKPTQTIYYELATPTNEQGTKYPENAEIDDYGMMYWLDEDDELVGIPQGAKFFYPVNYKGFLDDLHNRTEGDAGNVVTQSELSESETARDAVDAQLKDALGGTLRQLLALTKSIDFANTAWEDMGALTAWAYDATYDYFYATISDAKENGYVVCASYKNNTSATTVSQMSSGEIKLFANGLLAIKDSAYTDATAFKAAKKGVLFAFEKASS